MTPDLGATAAELEPVLTLSFITTYWRLGSGSIYKTIGETMFHQGK